MNKKKICFIAQFPPPIHGLSKAIETLYYSNLNAHISEDGEFEFEKIDLTKNKNLFMILFRLLKSNADLFYFTISQTKVGNLRDLIILILLEWKHNKCLIHLHGGYYRQLVDQDMNILQSKINYKVISQLAGVIVLSKSLNYIFDGMITNNKIFTVSNCVDDAYVLPDKRINKKMNSLKHTKKVHILWLSNFIYTKGYSKVLEIAKLEKQRVEKGQAVRFHFHFAGKFFEKKEQQFFEKYIIENKLNNYVSYHGIVTGQQKCKLLEFCNIFILPTRYPNEGQPISILEAMGNAMMIVATNHAGIPDIVKDNFNGILIKENDNIEYVYEKLILFDNKKIEEISRRNRAYYQEQFTQKKYINTMKSIFAQLT